MRASLPPLAFLATFFACVDLTLVRIALRGSESDALWKAVAGPSRLPIVIVAIASMVALLCVLVDVLKMPPPPRFVHRLNLALFTGIFVPAIAASTFIPRTVLARDTNFLVVLTTVSAAFVTMLLCAIAVRKHGPLAFRMGALLLLLNSAMGLFHIITTSLSGLGRFESAASLGVMAEKVSLVCYCLIPIALAVGGLSKMRGLSVARHLGASLISGLIFAAIFVFGAQSEIGLSLGLTPLATLWEALPIALVGVFSLSAVVLIATRHINAGAAMLLLLCAGFSPTAPGYLVMTALAAALLMRASTRYHAGSRHTEQAPVPS